MLIGFRGSGYSSAAFSQGDVSESGFGFNGFGLKISKDYQELQICSMALQPRDLDTCSPALP